MKAQEEPMDASTQFCLNEACAARGTRGAGTSRVPAYHPQRYRCLTCKKTCSARRGTLLKGVRTPTGLVMVVVTLLCYGCPTQAIVPAFDLDERTVAAWQKRAGHHCQRLHEILVAQGNVVSTQVQADEIRAKGRKFLAWIALALDATSRLWLAGVVSEHTPDPMLRIDGMISSDIQVVSVLKGNTKAGISKMISQYWPHQGERFLMFSQFQGNQSEPDYYAAETFRIVPLSPLFSTNSLAGKSIDRQIQIIFQSRLADLKREIKNDTEEKQRLEEWLTK